MERKQEQDTTDDRQKQGNPADETVIYKIGGTFYEVSTSCGGSEPLFEKDEAAHKIRKSQSAY